MRVFLIGSTGFTGSHIVDMILDQGWELTCYIRPTSDISSLQGKSLRRVYGVLEDVDALSNAAQGHDVMIHLANLSLVYVTNMIEACKRARIKRLMFTSSTGIFTKLDPEIKHVKLEAERLIKESGLDYTIFRPTMIYGSKRDRNMIKLIRFMQKLHVFPVFGNGTYLQQPVYVQDLARSYVLAIQSENSKNKAYNISGKEPVSYNQVIDITAKLLGRRVWKLHLPVWLSILGVKLARKITRNYKFTVEQVLRLNEHKHISHEEAKEDFGYHALSFAEGMANEVNSLKQTKK